MQPRQMRETSMPVEPSFVYLMSALYEAAAAPDQRRLLGANRPTHRSARHSSQVLERTTPRTAPTGCSAFRFERLHEERQRRLRERTHVRLPVVEAGEDVPRGSVRTGDRDPP